MQVLVTGTMLQLAGIVALIEVMGWWAHPTLAVVEAVLTVFGFGQGLVMAPLSGLVLATVRTTQAGSGAGILNTVQQVAGATGVSPVGMLCFQGELLAALALLGVSSIATAVWLIRMAPKRGPGNEPLIATSDRTAPRAAKAE